MDSCATSWLGGSLALPDPVSLGDSGALSMPIGRLGAARHLRRVLREVPESEPVRLISHFTHDLPAIRFALLGSPDVRLTVIKHVSPGPPKRDPVHRFLYRRVDRLLAVSEYVRRKCERTYPINPAKTAVWHPGIDTGRFTFRPEARARLRADADVSDSVIVLGYVARITPNKGLEDLIQAAGRLRSNGRDVVLWLVGSSSEDERTYEESLRRMASELGGESVRFWGRRENVEDFYSAFDIFVVPSRTEAFGLTTIEAMSCARPVIGFNAGGTAEIVEDGRTGILAAPEDCANHEALAGTIWNLIADPDRPAMGERARVVAEARFSIVAMLERLEKLMA